MRVIKFLPSLIIFILFELFTIAFENKTLQLIFLGCMVGVINCMIINSFRNEE